MKLLAHRILSVAAFSMFLVVGQRFVMAAPNSGSLLVQAYSTLEVADHDYKGHRVAAMKQIEDAAAILGVDVHGQGRGHEKQGVSDQQLRKALNLLQQARVGLEGKALKHVDNAIGQVSTALSIK